MIKSIKDLIEKLAQNGNQAAKLIPEMVKLLGSAIVLNLELKGDGSFDDTPSTGTGKVTFSGSGSGESAIPAYDDQVIGFLKDQYPGLSYGDNPSLMKVVETIVASEGYMPTIVVTAKAKGLNTASDVYTFVEPLNFGGKSGATSGVCSSAHVVIA